MYNNINYSKIFCTQLNNELIITVNAIYILYDVNDYKLVASLIINEVFSHYKNIIYLFRL